MLFQALSWYIEPASKEVIVFGRSDTHHAVACRVKGYKSKICLGFTRPFKDIQSLRVYNAVMELLKPKLCTWKRDPETNRLNKVCSYETEIATTQGPFVEKSSLWGFSFGKLQTFWEVHFVTIRARTRILSFFKRIHAAAIDDALLSAISMNVDKWLDSEDLSEFYSNRAALGNVGGCHQCLSQIDVKTCHHGQLKPWEKTDQPLLLCSVCATSNKCPHGQRKIVKSVVLWICDLVQANLPLSLAQVRVYEAIDPVLRFAHWRDLAMAGWITMPSAEPLSVNAYTLPCTQEYLTDYHHLKRAERDGICPSLIEMAFDIEVYSCQDGVFPSPTVDSNVVFQIGMTLKQYNVKQMKKYLLHYVTPPSVLRTGDGECASIEDCQVTNVKSEKDLLLAFRDFITQHDPDIIYGYNTDGFDWNYLFARSKHIGCYEQFCRLSRLGRYKCFVEEAEFASSAYGDNKYLRVTIPGRMNIDVMTWIQRNMPPDRYKNYKLDTVAKLELASQKHDVTPNELFAAFRTGTDCTRMGAYCIQDTSLVQELVDKLDIVTQMVEMANITHTPPMYLLHKGQQIKVLSQIAKYADDKGFLVPLADERAVNEAFKGAVVLDPIPGYYDTPVAVLDFASLYPSIQVAYQICYTTIVLDPTTIQALQNLQAKGHYSDPGGRGVFEITYQNVRFSVIQWSEPCLVYHRLFTKAACEFLGISYHQDENVCKEQCKAKGHWTSRTFNDESHVISSGFVASMTLLKTQLRDETVTRTIQTALKTSTKTAPTFRGPSDLKNTGQGPGYWRKETRHYWYAFAQEQSSIIPELQMYLKTFRKRVKKLMAPLENASTLDDQMMYRVYNGRQLAIKVSMNSIYGFTSAFVLNLKALSAAVTARGRQMIEMTQRFMEGPFDTLASKEGWSNKPLSVKVVGGDSVVADTPILCKDMLGFLYYETIEFLAESPWVLGEDKERHYATSECMIWTDSGWTSIVHIMRHKTQKKIFGVQSRQGYVEVTEDHSLLRSDGSKLSPLDITSSTCLLQTPFPDIALLTMNICDPNFAWALGFFCRYGRCAVLTSWTIQHSCRIKLQRAATIFGDIFKDIRLQIVKVVGGYRLCASSTTPRHLLSFSKQFRNMFYNKADQKRVPKTILNSTMNVMAKFINGFWDGEHLTCAIVIHGKLLLAGLYFLLDKVTANTSTVLLQRKTQGLALKTSCSVRSDTKLTQVMWLANIDNEDCDVYDIETGNHHFNVGPGKMVVHNTDSVFCHFPNHTVDETIALCGQAEKVLTRDCFARYPIEMEYEKTYGRLVILKKKNYVGIKYEKDTTHFKIDYKGIAVRRRDKAAFVKEALWAVIHKSVGIEIENGITRLIEDKEASREDKLEAIVSIFREKVMQLATRQVPLADLQLWRSLKGHYVQDNIPHVQLARRLAQRDPGSAPKPGSRFAFILTDDPTRSADISSRAEDMDYMIAHNLQPDLAYYLVNQLQNPLIDFLEKLGLAEKGLAVIQEGLSFIQAQAKSNRQILEKDEKTAFIDCMKKGKKRLNTTPLAPLIVKKPSVTKAIKMEKVKQTHLPLTQYFKKV